MHITVRVIPRSSKNGLEWHQGALKARITASPVAGAANEALIALIAEHLGLPKRNIRIVHGATSRQKTVEILGLTPELVQQKIAARRFHQLHEPTRKQPCSDSS